MIYLMYKSAKFGLVLTLNRPGFLKPSTAGGGGADSAPLCKTLPESPMILKFGTVIDHHKLYSKI